MGKKSKKTGKERLDKFYYLAKEQGYRSRAAFKLIQLNRKYNFLEKATSLLDLCAAPGGWCQVASKHMPVTSKIIGVDLAAIKPIRNVVTFVEDITTQSCRAAIKKEMGGGKVQVVLHDGAPNVGQNWVHDAYSQSELVLHALHLACDHLAPNGWFVTKVFRSSDYNSLLWAFNQLFKRVEATKPQASRNASAEIFVVCQGFLAPKRIDPKMFNPKFIFKEVEGDAADTAAAEKSARSIFDDSSRVRHRTGYEDGNLLLFKKCPISRFVTTESPVALLADYNQFTWDEDEESKKYAQHPESTPVIKEMVSDLKVIGRADFRQLLKWRGSMLAETHGRKDDHKKKEKKQEEQKGEEATLDDDKLVEKLAELQEEAHIKKRKLERRAREKFMKMKARAGSGGALNSQDAALYTVDQDIDLFSLNKIKSKEALDQAMDVPLEALDRMDTDFVIESDDEDSKRKQKTTLEVDMGDHASRTETLNDEFEKMFQWFLEQKRKRRPTPQQEDEEKKEEEETLEGGEADDESSTDGENDSDDEPVDAKNKNPLLVDLKEEESKSASRTAKMWFSQPLFKDILGNTSAGAPSAATPKKEKKQEKKRKRAESDISGSEDDDYEAIKDMQPAEEDIGAGSDSDDEKKKKRDRKKKSDQRKELVAGFDEVPAQLKNPRSRNETLALATVMLEKKARSRVIDDSYNRYTGADDEDLPEWFAMEEKKYNRKHLPLNKELIAKIKSRFEELNNAPIKKVAEAKARKKRKLDKKVTAAKEKAQAIADNSQASEKEKASQLRRLYKATQGKGKPGKVYTVGKSFNGGSGGKSFGTKMVDKKLKKDKRGTKRAEARKKGRK